MRVRVSCGRTRGRAVVRSAPRSYVMPRGRTLEPGYRTTTSEKVRPRRVGYDRAREGTTGREKVRPRGAARVVRAASGNGGPCASPPSGGFCADSPVEPRVRTSPRRRRTDLGAELDRSRCGTRPPRSRDMTRPAAPGCLSRPAGPCRRGARTPGSHIRGSASSFAGAIGAGSLRPASTSVTDRSTGSPTLTTRPVRRQ